MSTVIVARDYAAAATAAAQLGLGLDWTYPVDAEHMLGLAITRVVYVEGWETSPTLDTAAVSAMFMRMTSGATETHVEIHRPHDAFSPFLEAVTPTTAARNIQHGQRRRRPISPWWLVPIAGVLGFAGAAVADMLGIWP